MTVIISTIILIFLIDTFLIGISFYSLKERFQWNISNRICLLILFIIFALLENYYLPMIVTLDMTYTVGNANVAKLLDLKPNKPFADLFGFGLFEFIVWGVQAILASAIGEKLIINKSKQVV